MAAFNSCTLVGHLGRDPELRYTPNGKAVCNFSIAVKSSYAGRDGNKNEDTLWMRVSCWEKTAENVSKYTKKGDPVLVNGELKLNKFTDKDGNERETIELTAHRVVFLAGARGDQRDGDRDERGGREGGFSRGQSAPNSNKNPGGRCASRDREPPPEEDDIPF